MTNKQFSVFGITTSSQLVDIDSVASQERNMDWDDTDLYVLNEVHKQDFEDDDFKFDYQYCIEVYYDNNNELTLYHLFLVPTFNSLSEKRQNDIIDFCGTDEPTIDDILSYGCSILMASECVKAEPDREKVNQIATILPCIDGMRGFYLDKAQNRIGTTGWMMLDDFLHDKDFLKETLNAYKNEN